MDATQHGGWGAVGHVNVPCNLHALWMLRNTSQHGGWGEMGHVNVPCNLHALWMLRNTGVGVGWGMLTFHVTEKASQTDGNAMRRPGMKRVEKDAYF